MLINFTLAPIEEIVPWGEPGSYSLHWFGLTYGEYWIQAGEAALFEYSDHARNAGINRYCDYQVVRLYEDLLDMLPYILEPVPEPLVPYICGERAKAWQNAYDAWRDRDDDVLIRIIFAISPTRQSCGAESADWTVPTFLRLQISQSGPIRNMFTSNGTTATGNSMENRHGQRFLALTKCREMHSSRR